MWGEAPLALDEIYEVFARYIEGSVPVLPWCESALASETHLISADLAAINRAGFLTINSQPAVNAAPSDHSIFGWGGTGGYVYQKAYVEFFCSPELFAVAMKRIQTRSNLCYYAIDASGSFLTNQPERGTGGRAGDVTALTWGVFPNREVLQPTVFDRDTFKVWSKEAFQLWVDAWASLYEEESESNDLLYQVHDTFYLVAIVDNDFIGDGSDFVGLLTQVKKDLDASRRSSNQDLPSLSSVDVGLSLGS
jgi:methylenetetrahydrofolate reductase (NADPH)